jgi:hypothetical protein
MQDKIVLFTLEIETVFISLQTPVKFQVINIFHTHLAHACKVLHQRKHIVRSIVLNSNSRIMTTAQYMDS